MRNVYCWMAKNNESSGVCMHAFVCAPVSVFEWKQMENTGLVFSISLTIPFYTMP